MSPNTVLIWKTAAIVCILAACGLTGCQKNSATDSKAPPQQAALQNPMAGNPGAIADGQKLYVTSDCAICHGKDGDGKGVLAKDISMNTHDWRDATSLVSFTDGDLFNILANGKGRMPGYGKKESPDQMWKLIDYIRSLGKK
ncbi:MAG: c-type cytochrome [Candidatus Acidiferrales bacterium]